MSTKLLIRLLTAVGVLVVAWVVLALVRRPPEDRSVSLSMPKVDTAKVDSAVLIKGHDTVVLTRARKRWRANGYAADSTAVQSLLKGLADTTRSTEQVAQNRSSHERLGVGPDSGERVVVVAGGRVQLDLVAGKRTADYDGAYVRRSNEDPAYALHGPLVESLTRGLDDWRDKRIAGAVADSVAKIDIQRGGRGYVLERSGAAWRLAAGKSADSAAVVTLLNDYKDVRASGFPTKAQADSIDFKTAKTRARLLSKTAAPLVDLVFDSTASGLWVRADSGGPAFKVDSWLWGRLTPPESTLAAKKPATPPAADATAKRSDGAAVKKKK